MTIELEDPERHLLLKAMATLAVKNPKYDVFLREIARKLEPLPLDIYSSHKYQATMEQLHAERKKR